MKNICIYVIVSSLFILTKINLASANVIENDILHMSFEEALSDAEVILFINKHQILPTAFFMWVEGRNYSHRIYELENKNINAKDFVQSVRDEMTRTENRNSDKSSAINRAEEILNSVTEEEFLNNLKAQHWVKYFINNLYHKEKAYKAIKANNPIIYGLEFVASTEKLRSIREDDLVILGHIKSEDIAIGMKTEQELKAELGEKQSLDGIKPKKYQVYGHTDYLNGADGHQLWSILNRIKQTGVVNEGL